MAPKITLDTNCLINLEEDRVDAPHIRALIRASRDGRVELAVVAVSASENQAGGTVSRDYRVFEEKLRRIDLADAHRLLPLAIWDIFYWDHALWSSAELETLAHKIQSILFPGEIADGPSKIGDTAAWRNRYCDIFVAWSCMHHGWEFLVTRDENFHRHKKKLVAMGLRDVLHPADAVALVGSVGL